MKISNQFIQGCRGHPYIFRPFGYMSIVVYFEDGMKMIYDDLRKQAHITA